MSIIVNQLSSNLNKKPSSLGLSTATNLGLSVCVKNLRLNS